MTVRQTTMFGVDPKTLEPPTRGRMMSRVWKVCREHPEALEHYHLLLFYVWEEDGLLKAAEEGPDALRNFFLRATSHSTISRAYRKAKELGYIREPKSVRLRRRRAESIERERWQK